jgi:hypothetical protein
LLRKIASQSLIFVFMFKLCWTSLFRKIIRLLLVHLDNSKLKLINLIVLFFHLILESDNLIVQTFDFDKLSGGVALLIFELIH